MIGTTGGLESVEIDVIREPGINLDLDDDAIRALCRFTLEREGVAGDWSISVVLTTDRRLRELHRDFMGIDEETDVMTFPFGSGDVPAEQGGDIVISVERAADNAPAFSGSAVEEVRFLTVHGLLHLCGWLDERDDQRTAMLTRQSEVLSAFDAETAGVDS
jgi:probable rRNA maturation factor